MYLKIFPFFVFLLYSGIAFSQTMTETTALSFCDTIVDQNGGIIQKNTSGCSSISGSHTFVTVGFTAEFKIKGTPLETIDLVIFDSTLTGPGTPINLQSLLYNPETIVLNSKGEVTFTVIGQAVINPAQTHGSYSGTYTIQYGYPSAMIPKVLYANASLEILPIPITINSKRHIDFSDVAADPAGGTIRLNTDGSLENLSGNSTFLSSGLPGDIKVTGSPNTEVSISLYSGTLIGPGNDLQLHHLRHDAISPIMIDEHGNLDFLTGARLDIGSNQTPGVYSGQYTVEVIY